MMWKLSFTNSLEPGLLGSGYLKEKNGWLTQLSDLTKNIKSDFLGTISETISPNSENESLT